MVGFKTFWITLTLLFMVGACVPQAKQTACKGNEAYDASLRRCVPVTQDPDQAMTFSSYLPLAPIQKHKGEVTPVTLTVNVSNPYTQSYRIVWDRTFNGTTTTLSTTANTSAATQQFTHQFVPATLATQIGLHMFRATIRNAANDSVNVKMFEVVIQDDGTPTVHTPSIEPIGYNVEATPIDPPIQFRLDMNPNASDTIIFAANYKLVWQVYRSSLEVPSQTSTEFFASVPRSGSRFQFSKVINPGHADLGIGNYIIRATVSNSVNTVVAQHTWSLAVNHPQLGLINSVSFPAPGVTTTAYNGLSYDLYPAYNFLYPTAQRPQYCVSLNKPTGTYPADGQGVYVRYYLNGVGAHIYQQETSDVALFEEICLIGGTSTFNQALLKFVNPDNISPQTHKVTVRAFDRRTGIEFTGVNMAPSLGSYPVEWPVLVKSTNSAPVIGFGATKPATCVSNGAFAQDNCGVIQGTAFTVGFTVSDDFYDASVATAAQAGKFQWDVKLKHNGVDISGASCSKAFGATTNTVAGEYTCSLTVPHFIATGPLDPSSGTFSVVATLQDQDSPVDPIGRVANPITWNLFVSEDNSIIPNITIAPQTSLASDSNISKFSGGLYNVIDNAIPLTYPTEKDTIAFFLNVTDPELDNFEYQISRCTINTPSTCTGSTLISPPGFTSFIRSMQPIPTANPVLVNAFQYTLPEDLLLQVSPAMDIAAGASGLVHFKVDIVDKPSVISVPLRPNTPVRTDSKIFSVNVNNFNPAPVIDTATAVPLPGTVGLTAMVGYPFTINPGTVTDASVPSSEKTIVYQWYAKLAAGTWTAIDGATERILRWTPDQGATGPIDLKLCVGDRPAANPILPANPVPQCSAVWTVTPKNYLTALTAGDTPTNSTATWLDPSQPNVIYSAYIGSDNRIYVDKSIKDAAGNVNSSSVQTVSFNADETGLANAVSNISITGTSDSLYIAYLAGQTSIPVTTFYPRVRRLDKRLGKTALTHSGKFGFNYNAAVSCTSATACSVTPSNAGSDPVITFASGLTAGDTITINGYTFTAVNTAPTATEICDISTCTAGATASSLTTKINSSTHAALQGFTATWSGGGTVTIQGNLPGDYLDFNGTAGIGAISVAPDGIGKIFVQGSVWYLPVLTLQAGNTNELLILQGALNSPLANTTTRAVVTSNLVPGLGKMAKFDAQPSSTGHLIVAGISSDTGDAGQVKLSKLTLSGSLWGLDVPATDLVNIMNGHNFESVKVAANTTGNNSIFVLARTNSSLANGSDTLRYKMNRYNTALILSSTDSFLTDSLVTTDSTSTVISDSLLRVPQLVAVPNSSDARIFFASTGTPAAAMTLRMATFQSDNSISCGTCAPMTDAISGTTFPGVSPVVTGVTIGSAGWISGENQKDIVLITTHHASGAEARMGIINIKSEEINATSVDSTTHLFRPPFAKNY